MLKQVLLPVLLCASVASHAHAESKPLIVEHGVYSVHLLLHTVGREEYTVSRLPSGAQLLTTTSTTSDRGMKRTVTSTLEFGPQLEPTRFTQHSSTDAGTTDLDAHLSRSSVTLLEDGRTNSLSRHPVSFPAFGSMQAATEMLMMRYWSAHHRPARLDLLRAGSSGLPVKIKLVGHDAFEHKGRMIRLSRYTVENLVFGREILWLNTSGRVAAVMTFAGGLPQEEVLDEYEANAGELMHSGVQQEMLDLDDLNRAVRPELQGSFAIVGARLIDGTDAPAVENATVVVREGRISAIGTALSTTGLRVIHAEGKSLLPGLWESHIHYSGVEFGPALLAAGITTARDCGGELEFLTTLRRKLERDHSLGPRILLAGLIDSGGPLAFGAVDVRSPAEGVAAVNAYADAGFEQIKVYTQVKPEVLRAVSAAAHARGLSVTGHVPAAVDSFEGIADGMDQINHLQFVIRTMNPDGGVGHVDLTSERSRRLIALLKERRIVVDPTASWGETAGHPKDVDVTTFEPGIRSAPDTLASRYRALGVPADKAAAFHERMNTNREVISALHQAGVLIVAGSDTGLIGYGLDRELELYVQAGFTPMEAIQSATLVAARALQQDRRSGSLEVGKDADLVLIDGDPSRNISDIRKVVKVVVQGRLYDSKKLAASVGFSR